MGTQKRTWILPSILLMLVAGILACDKEPSLPEESADTPLFHAPLDFPEGIATTAEYIVVTNTAFQPADLSYGDGSLTVLDRHSGAHLVTLPTSGRNPQFVEVHGEHLWVVSTGATYFDTETGINTALEESHLDRFDLDTLLESEGPTESLPLPLSGDDSRMGGFGSIALSSNGQFAYIASGLAAIAYKADLHNMTLLRGPDNPLIIREHQLNDTLTVAAHPNGEILFTSFNANAIYRLNPETDDWVSEPVSLGESSEIQGPIDMAIGEGSQAKVYVAKSIANAISVWSPGGSVVSPDPFVSGPVTNRIIWNDNILYVVNSGANHVAEIEISSGSTKIVSAFPVGSNPWEVAIADGIGYVTLFQRNEVIAFDLNNGDWLWRSQAP